MFLHYKNLNNFPLQIVILERPYDTYTSSPFTRELLSETFKLKLSGYTANYPYGILPISETDFMGNHIVLCLKDGGKFLPITAFKSISNDVCENFRVPFPVINHKFGMFKDKFPEFVTALTSWQKCLEKDKKKFAYNSSWTISGEIEKELRNICREATMALFYHYYKDKKISNIINSASCVHNVEKLQEVMGFKYLQDSNGQKMSPFKSPVFFEEPFFIMHIEDDSYTEEFKKSCNQYQELWNNRIIISSDKNKTTRKVA